MKLCKLVSLAQREQPLSLVAQPQQELIKWEDGSELQKTQTSLVNNMSVLENKNLKTNAAFGKKDKEPTVINEISQEKAQSKRSGSPSKPVQTNEPQFQPNSHANTMPKQYLADHQELLKVKESQASEFLAETEKIIKTQVEESSKITENMGKQLGEIEQLKALVEELVQQADTKSKGYESSLDELSERIKAQKTADQGELKKAEEEKKILVETVEGLRKEVGQKETEGQELRGKIASLENSSKITEERVRTLNLTVEQGKQACDSMAKKIEELTKQLEEEKKNKSKINPSAEAPLPRKKRENIPSISTAQSQNYLLNIK